MVYEKGIADRLAQFLQFLSSIRYKGRILHSTAAMTADIYKVQEVFNLCIVNPNKETVRINRNILSLIGIIPFQPNGLPIVPIMN